MHSDRPTLDTPVMTKPEFEALPSMSELQPPNINDLAQFDSNTYPACVSNAHEHAFDSWADSKEPLFTHVDYTDIKSTSASTIASLLQSRAKQTTVPVSNIDVGLQNEASLRTLWDTGASYTILSQKAYTRLKTKLKHCEIQKAKGMTPTFMLANGDVCRPDGRVALCLKFGQEKVHHFAWVMKGGEFDLILGVDFFSRHNVSFKFTEGNQCVQLDGLDTKPVIPFAIRNTTTFRGSSSPLILKDDLLLQPKRRYRTHLEALNGDPLLHANHTGVLEGIDAGDDTQHFVTPAITTMRDGKTIAEICNFSDKPIRLQKGTLLGHFSLAVQATDADIDANPDTQEEKKTADTTPLNTINLDELIEFRVK